MIWFDLIVVFIIIYLNDLPCVKHCVTWVFNSAPWIKIIIIIIIRLGVLFVVCVHFVTAVVLLLQTFMITVFSFFFATDPGRTWPRSGTKKLNLRGKRSLVMPDRPAGQRRWRTNGFQKFRFHWIVFDCIWSCVNVLQGVTLTDLKEAQKISSLSSQDRQTEEGGTLVETSCLRKGSIDDSRVKTGLMESTETTEISPKWSKMDEVGKRCLCRSHFAEVIVF